MSIHVTFIVLCCIVLALAIHSAYCIKRFSLLAAMMSNKLLGLGLETKYSEYTQVTQNKQTKITEWCESAMTATVLWCCNLLLYNLLTAFSLSTCIKGPTLLDQDHIVVLISKRSLNWVEVSLLLVSSFGCFVWLFPQQSAVALAVALTLDGSGVVLY